MPVQPVDSVINTVARLQKDGLFAVVRGRVRLSSKVPKSFPALVRDIGKHLALTDHCFEATPAQPQRRVKTHEAADDNAPQLFGTVGRLRTLMVLAKYGPMRITDIRNVLGGSYLHAEGPANAPFGRGDVALVWDSPFGPAAALDPAHPLHRPLRRLLLKLEEAHPLPPLVRRYDTPKLPPKRPWNGDKLALFGRPIPTSILLSIGANGWTFEAICVTASTGRHRENVKKAMKRLEKEGVIEGDRPRWPGCDPRIVRIAKGFVARDELFALLDAAVRAWPEFRGRTEVAFRGLASKTKAHLRGQG